MRLDSQFPCFSGVPLKDVAIFAEAMRLDTYASGECIISPSKEGTEQTMIRLVHLGSLEITAPGDTCVLERLGPGSDFASPLDRVVAYDVVATEPTECYSIHRNAIKSLKTTLERVEMHTQKRMLRAETQLVSVGGGCAKPSFKMAFEWIN